MGVLFITITLDYNQQIYVTVRLEYKVHTVVADVFEHVSIIFPFSFFFVSNIVTVLRAELSLFKLELMHNVVVFLFRWNYINRSLRKR